MIKEKIDTFEYIKIQEFFPSDSIKRVKNQDTDQKIFAIQNKKKLIENL